MKDKEALIELRGKIDDIDKTILGALIERWNTVQNIIDVKKRLSLDMKDSKREREIMHELYRESDSKISYLYLKRIYTAIFNSEYERHKKVRKKRKNGKT
jgi:chorismate mutase